MRRWLAILLVLSLSGCSAGESALERGMSVRERFLQSTGCSFEACVTADYGDVTYTFTLSCQGDQQGNLSFTVIEPETISGISGHINASGGNLNFDETALAFSLLADGEVSPVSAPWIFLHTLRSGYLSSCGREEEYIRMTIDDSYEEDALQLDIWVDGNDAPVHAQILWQGRSVVTMDVRNFVFV